MEAADDEDWLLEEVVPGLTQLGQDCVRSVLYEKRREALLVVVVSSWNAI
jgi:hypothetical protein